MSSYQGASWRCKLEEARSNASPVKKHHALQSTALFFYQEKRDLLNSKRTVR